MQHNLHRFFTTQLLVVIHQARGSRRNLRPSQGSGFFHRRRCARAVHFGVNGLIIGLSARTWAAHFGGGNNVSIDTPADARRHRRELSQDIHKSVTIHTNHPRIRDVQDATRRPTGDPRTSRLSQAICEIFVATSELARPSRISRARGSVIRQSR